MKLRSKRMLSFFMSLALIFGVLLVPSQSLVYGQEVETINLSIVHTNDIHSRIEGNDSVIGLSRLATLVKQLRQDNPNLLLLDAGDTIHGLPIITVSGGEAMINLMNELGYDAMVPGNHDFNYGYNRLVELSKIAEFPILAANVIPQEGEMDLAEYVIKEIDGLKIGIFGIATEESKYKSNPKNTESVDITDPVAKSQEMVDKLKEEEVNMIIALSHIGLDEESSPKSSDIAEKVEGIDLIIDGHSHSKLDEGLLIGDTLIVQTGEHTKNVGIVNVEFKNGSVASKEASLVAREDVEELEEEENIKGMITDLKELNDEVLATVIGKTNVKLVGEREVVRSQESNFGNLMTDALLDLSEADIALTNGGGIRSSIEAGEITKNHVLSAFPFGNYGVKMEIKGIDILGTLEHGVAGYPAPEGKFPQVAGMTFKIDPAAEEGNRVYDVMVQGNPLDIDKTYTLATNDFMAVGGDGYVNLSNGNIVAEYAAFDEILAQYIEKLGVVDIEVEGRIVPEERKLEEEVVEEVPAKPEVPNVVVEEKQPIETIEEVYIVKVGDTLYRIGLKHNTTWQELAKYNNLSNPHLIFPNQQILIPVN